MKKKTFGAFLIPLLFLVSFGLEKGAQAYPPLYWFGDWRSTDPSHPEILRISLNPFGHYPNALHIVTSCDLKTYEQKRQCKGKNELYGKYTGLTIENTEPGRVCDVLIPARDDYSSNIFTLNVTKTCGGVVSKIAYELITEDPKL